MTYLEGNRFYLPVTVKCASCETRVVVETEIPAPVHQNADRAEFELEIDHVPSSKAISDVRIPPGWTSLLRFTGKKSLNRYEGPQSWVCPDCAVRLGA